MSQSLRLAYAALAMLAVLVIAAPAAADWTAAIIGAATVAAVALLATVTWSAVPRGRPADSGRR